MTETGGLEHRRDLLSIVIVKNPEEKENAEVVARAKGSYLETIKYEEDESAIWSINSDVPRLVLKDLSNDKRLLPSDSNVRPDARLIITKDWDEAESAKHELEQRQRADKKLRIAAKEARDAKAKE